MKRDGRTYRVALSGLLVAIMLIMGYVESLVPISAGVPGIKPGFSNGVLIFAVYMLDIPTAYCLMALKVLLSGLMFGGLSAMMYAFAGGILSLTCMCLLSGIPRMKPQIAGIAGGAMHNVGQTLLAMLIMHTGSLVWYMAVLIPVGMLCGFITGSCASALIRHLKLPELPANRGRRVWISVIIAAVLIAVTAFVAVKSNPISKKDTTVTWEAAPNEVQPPFAVK